MIIIEYSECVCIDTDVASKEASGSPLVSKEEAGEDVITSQVLYMFVMNDEIWIRDKKGFWSLSDIKAVTGHKKQIWGEF